MTRNSACLCLSILLLLLLPSFASAEAWVLICPPRGILQDMQMPIGKWEQESAHDSASDCEGQRQFLTQAMVKIPWNTEEERIKRASAINFFMSCRCMPYDLWWRSKQPQR